MIRSFVGNRLPHAEGESRSEDQRNIKGIFSQLSLHESPKAGLIEAEGFATPPIESRRFFGENTESQSLAGDADVDQDMSSDNSTLG